MVSDKETGAMDDLLSLRAASDLLNIPERRLLVMIDRGVVHSVRSDGQVLIPRAEIARYHDRTADVLLARMEAREQKRFDALRSDSNDPFRDLLRARTAGYAIIALMMLTVIIWSATHHDANRGPIPTPTPVQQFTM
jgi:hypothetical protein